MRGKRRHSTLSHNSIRIIPAHAGQTGSSPAGPHGRPDHPRACGANSVLENFSSPLIGSSPRMRGKPRPPPCAPRRARIIPAHAGQTKPQYQQYRRPTDHPRACGANRLISVAAVCRAGSSPRMRGKPVRANHLARNTRIIPAHAGQTHLYGPIIGAIPDHPRACGANSVKWSCGPVRCGSSPRMRGKQSDFMRKLLSAGPSIIGFAQWLQSSYYCSCLQSSAKTPISRGTTPTSLFLGFQNSITLLLLT